MNQSDKSTLQKLKPFLTFRFSAVQLIIALMLFILGWAMVTQIKLQRSDPFDGLPEAQLVTILDDLSANELALREEKARLEVELANLKNEYSKAEAAEKAIARERELAEISAGVVPVEGPGLIMTIVDPDNQARVQNFVMVLGELRNAGAEGVSLNGIRVNASTYIEKGDRGILVNGIPISSPYVFSIIGDADTIQPALEIARGAGQQFRARGATVSYLRVDSLQILEVALVPTLKYGKIVESEPRS
ncbi:DUF881 domain-containing protein [Gleimia sp. 6138-11-ORH1]|uniref:DUF881 domain-containing protein n=1 Tax=Gleimia sp. 6138-11-ORH1 TaxID=2973937 RepID=UPI002168C6AB|nr:DUF881 domain-containing protein [Gleimia sp. 6138-11-ORH1]MCS4484345.1 DUF881 domain-containing protein [Gleimia sp. 6138-11-ORH1]